MRSTYRVDIVKKLPRIFCVGLSVFACQTIAESIPLGQVSQPGRPNLELVRDKASVSDGAGPGVEEKECRQDRVQSLLTSGDRIGFGSNTTGGSDAKEFMVVNNLADSGPGTLREAISRDGPKWIIFDSSVYGGTILLESPLRIPMDTTIDGRGAGRMSGIKISPSAQSTHVMLMWEGNVILHGITIDGRRAGATGVMLRTGDNYWIDHVTITGFDSDDALTVGRGSSSSSTSEVTVSNYHAYDTSKGFLAGGEIEYYETYRTHRVSIFNSLLNARDRNPHISAKGQAHFFNNLVVPTASSGIEARHGAVLIAENNIISGEYSQDKKSGMIARTLQSGIPTGHIFSRDNELVNGAGTTGSINPGNVNQFWIPYDYPLMDTSMVESYVRNNAGADNASFDLTVCD